jgi:hypothetical protein
MRCLPASDTVWRLSNERRNSRRDFVWERSDHGDSVVSGYQHYLRWKIVYQRKGRRKRVYIGLPKEEPIVGTLKFCGWREDGDINRGFYSSFEGVLENRHVFMHASHIYDHRKPQKFLKFPVIRQYVRNWGYELSE